MKLQKLSGPMITGLILVTGCVGNRDLNTLSMKGYELYSWPAGEEWNFALLAGTNRLKTLEEIQSPAQTLHGVEAAKTALRELPEGEQVFWEGPGWLQQNQAAAGDLALPPAPIREEITVLCSQLGISLTVSD